MIKIQETNLQGCFELQPKRLEDERGCFIKTFHGPTFRDLGLCAEFNEEYYSVSTKGVIRGMHFQLPPDDHVKLVYCTVGKVLDVVLDIRKGSPTYGKCEHFELNADKANMVYIPKGMAHGFCVLSDSATMLYKVSTVYSPKCDAGIRWDSIGFDWGQDTPTVSERDSNLQGMSEFDSPFVFKDLL